MRESKGNKGESGFRRESYRSSVILALALIRSMGVGDFTEWPWEDLTPLIAWMAERRSENARRHLSQHSVLLWVSPISKQAWRLNVYRSLLLQHPWLLLQKDKGCQ